MCATATYWAGIGRIVFALSGARLRELLPSGAPYLALDTRELFARGNRVVRVEGPCPELEAEALAVHEGFWGPRAS
jgi:tRNA(Arg) A34 adenosine deaminase TadA